MLESKSSVIRRKKAAASKHYALARSHGAASEPKVHFYKAGGIEQSLPSGVWNRSHN